MNIVRTLPGIAIVLLIGAAVTSLNAQDSSRYLPGNAVTNQTQRSTISRYTNLSPRLALSRQTTAQQLQLQANGLVEELKAALAATTDEEKAAAKPIIESTEDQLRTVVSQQFDELMQGRDIQVRELRERINRLKTEITKSRDAEAQIVELRLQTLLNEANGLGFPSPRPKSSTDDRVFRQYFESTTPH